MNRHVILATLRSTESTMKDLGVRHAALFGSRARDNHHLGSDLAIMSSIPTRM